VVLAIQESEIQVGKFYMTPGKQLRRVTELVLDDQGRTRVHYECKSGKKKNQAFVFGPNRSNPPFLSTFAKACDRLLSGAEIKQLRIGKILRAGE
jgi:hypothetical protein